MARTHVIFPYDGHPPVRSGDHEDTERAALARLAELVPDLQEAEGEDYETFWETALMALAAASLGPVTVMSHSKVAPEDTRVILGRVPNGKHAGMNDRWWEYYTGQPPLWPDAHQAAMADTYFLLDTFRDLAGRRMALAGFPSDDGGYDRWVSGIQVPTTNLFTAVRGMLSEGVRKMYLKVTIPKYMGMSLTFPPGADDRTIRGILAEALDYTPVHLEGYGDAVLLQEHVEMRKEYRCVVVDGQVVSGAGRVPQFTPFDRLADGAWDARVVDVAGSSDVIELSTEELAAYQYLAGQATERFAKEHGLVHYVLDLAMVGDDPVIVELNPTMNFGLYANDPERIVKAISEWVGGGSSRLRP